LQILLEDTQGPVDILANVSPASATRSAAEACLLKFTAFNTDLLQNEKIYARFQRTAPTDAIDRKLKKDVTEAFEDTGVALPPAPRAHEGDPAAPGGGSPDIRPQYPRQQDAACIFARGNGACRHRIWRRRGATTKAAICWDSNTPNTNRS
jgi:hypothetical protein